MDNQSAAEDADRGPRFREIPRRLLIPNIITVLAVCAGLTGIRLAYEGKIELAVIMVLVAAFLDGIDGRVARLLKAQTNFGAQLDSLAVFLVPLALRRPFPDLLVDPHLVATVNLSQVCIAVTALPQVVSDGSQDSRQRRTVIGALVEGIDHVTAIGIHGRVLLGEIHDQ